MRLGMIGINEYQEAHEGGVSLLDCKAMKEEKNIFWRKWNIARLLFILFYSLFVMKAQKIKYKYQGWI